jgi:hypothetical protein
MWRSLFYAIGVGLMVLGGEALIFERVTINPDAKLPAFAERLLETTTVPPKITQPSHNQYAFGGTRGVGGIPNAVGSNAGQVPRVLPASSGFGNGYSSQSRFGPSRFAGPANGGYGGGRIGFGQNSKLGTPQAGRSSTPAKLASSSNPVGTRYAGGRAGPRKQIVTKDWMPWSLFAVGAVVFLYTHTSRRRYSD